MAPAPGLIVYAFDNPKALWDHIHLRWSTNKDSKIVLSPFAKQRFLQRYAQETQFSSPTWEWNLGKHEWEQKLTDRIVLLRTLDRAVQGMLELDSKPTLRPFEQVAYIKELLEKRTDIPEELRQLRHSNNALAVLLAHVGQMQTRADLLTKDDVFTDVERGIIDIRDQMTADRAHTESAMMSASARRAKEVDIRHPLLIAPAVQVTPQLAGLAKGLAYKQAVRLYLLTTKTQLPAVLKQANLVGREVQEHFDESNAYASRLFTSKRPLGQRDERHLWFQAGDECESALDIVQGWVEEGIEPTDIAIVSASEESEDRLRALAGERALGLHIRGNVKTPDNALGTLLADIARYHGNPARDEQFIHEGTLFSLAEDDLLEVHEARSQQDLLGALAKLGDVLLERKLQMYPITDQVRDCDLWMKVLREDVAAYEETRLWPDDALEAILDVNSEQQTYGNPTDIAVIPYRQASSIQYTHAVYLSLHAGGYPGKVEDSPFVSEVLLQAVPLLNPEDYRHEFATAVVGAKTAVFAYSSAGGQSAGPYFEESRRAATVLGQKPPALIHPKSLTRKRVLQRLARSGVQHKLLTDAQHRAVRKRLPAGVLNGQRDSFSVTELELFLSCPYGWFVRYVLRPAYVPSPAAQRGTLQHRLLEKTTAQPDGQKLDFLQEEIDKAVAARKLPEIEAATEKLRLQAIVERYSGPDWPFSNTYSEVTLSSEKVLPGFKIKGRVDRIDIGDAGALVIDYKKGRTPAKKSATQRHQELQRYLYPLLAAERYSTHVLGGIYISVRYGDHDGSLTRPIAALNTENVDYNWEEDSQVALDMAMQAIDDIQQGNFNEIGKNCPDYCPHHLLSQTVSK